MSKQVMSASFKVIAINPGQEANLSENSTLSRCVPRSLMSKQVMSPLLKVIATNPGQEAHLSENSTLSRCVKEIPPAALSCLSTSVYKKLENPMLLQTNVLIENLLNGVRNQNL
ncbi:hypothetical protein CEXT_715971 [Caerostris extrusa]|uniref:Uncharacterized protein n=1 Tax=Caerostris extrusa TaxID=172846 RepID=A0AAV4TD36_CAEEX|nr:hypothetical protein CEXT_715971 [Caerostris extrusa]